MSDENVKDSIMAGVEKHVLLFKSAKDGGDPFEQVRLKIFFYWYVNLA